MKKGEYKKKSGFTIIEVSLVLAIAGLIMMVVFIALPALQRQQRDSQRRDDIMSFLETVKKYQTNNRGALPANDAAWQNDFFAIYLGDDFTDPDGIKYSLTVVKCESAKDVNCESLPTLSSMDRHRLYVYEQATCKDSETAVGASNPRNIAVLHRMEGSGMYCANT